MVDFYKQFPPAAVFRRNKNMALMASLANALSPWNNRQIHVCLHIYRKTKSYTDIIISAACARRLFRANADRVKLYPKGTAWVRDIWLTNSLWSGDGDFMLHGCKSKLKSTYNTTPPKLSIDSTGRWYSPFAGSININRCTQGNTS